MIPPCATSGALDCRVRRIVDTESLCTLQCKKSENGENEGGVLTLKRSCGWRRLPRGQEGAPAGADGITENQRSLLGQHPRCSPPETSPARHSSVLFVLL
eukprot:scaffold25405_cov33-Tisochrysis_lutea.AAC.1